MAKRAGDNELLGKDGKRPCPGPFQTKGELEDEVTLRFDDERELYVSSSFLKMTSPVFKAMLESDFTETQTRVILLKSKRYEHFLVMLKSLHPGLQTPIPERVMLCVLPIAHEYQVQATIQQCSNGLTSLLHRMVQVYIKMNRGSPKVIMPQALCKVCLQLLKCAHLYSIPCEPIAVIKILSTQKAEFYHPTSNQKHDDCVQLFTELPDSLKIELLLHRLERRGY